MKNITINNQIISVNLSDIGDDYLSLTDLAKFKDLKFPARVINNWLRNKSTIDFIGIWEKINNVDFKLLEFEQFKKDSGNKSFTISSDKWIKFTSSIGIKSASGRYGGTFAHKDIAFEFATWLNPEFKLYVIKEFQRLKNEEAEVKNLDWNVKRVLTKINYKIHINSIRQNIIIPQKIKNSSIIYANEADILNMALFGITAKDWKLNNKDLEGNMRDYADVTQLICLSNLEVLNSEFIKSGLSQKERLIKLNEIAISQMTLLVNNNMVKKLV
jgi:hypothetical protein